MPVALLPPFARSRSSSIPLAWRRAPQIDTRVSHWARFSIGTGRCEKAAIFAVRFEVGPDERADRDDAEAARPRIVESRLDEARTRSVTAELGRNLGMQEDAAPTVIAVGVVEVRERV